MANSRKTSDWDDYKNRRVACNHCGASSEHHRVQDGKCPPTAGWGSVLPFPRWPSSIKDEKQAGQAFDERLASYWGSAKTHYSPMR